jgi:hypothetical protein
MMIFIQMTLRTDILFLKNLILCADSPKCGHSGVVAVGASLGTAVKVRCEVDAFPPATAFSWIFNNSKVCSKGVVVGASLGTAVKVCCEVDAFPPATAFSWIFNNSKVYVARVW